MEDLDTGKWVAQFNIHGRLKSGGILLSFKKHKTMKYIFALIFFVGISQTNAQQYHPLVKEGKYWIYGHYASSECFQLWQIATEIRYFFGDTIINGQTYKKLISSFVPVSLPYNITSKKSLCYMREDTIQRKVFIVNYNEYVFPCADGNEVCIWDFGLNIGDTIKNCTYDIFYPIDFGSLTHNIIDTIQNLPSIWGFEQKHFFTIGISPGQCNDPGIFPVSYIEGFGMEDGPMLKNFGTYLSDFCEGTLEQCNIIISGTKDTPFDNSSRITISPNPSSEFITIETALDINVVEIIDQNGMAVLRVNDKEIDVSNLIPGVYFVRCTTLEKEMYYNKFIKI
jgi:hypothetical protein